jgi:hypothetical protein
MTYLAAGSEVLALSSYTFVIIDIVLPAVFGLVLVREASVKAYISEVNEGN